MKLLYIMLIFSLFSCKQKPYKYSVKAVVGGLNRTYYTNSYELREGCVSFIDVDGESYLICGNFTIN